MKKVYILRGIPGSGKSSLAQELASKNGRIHSTDDYFYRDGEFRFVPQLLHKNHDLNFTAFCSSLRDKIDTVIVDNTNTQIWEYERYMTAAKWYDYEVEIIFLPHPAPEVAAERTVHKVPLETIKAMLSRWEADEREVTYVNAT